MSVWELRKMADLEIAGRHLSFDDILEAVQESRRGRWFLQEYEARMRGRDTLTVLAAIERLQANMTSLAPVAKPAMESVEAQAEPQQAPPGNHGTRYFEADANLFERTTPAKPVLVQAEKPEAAPTPPLPAEEPAPQGAKLIIRKAGSGETAAPFPDKAPAAIPAAEAPPPAQIDAPVMDSPRIVMVRRKPEDMPEFAMPPEPLAASLAEPSAA
jgi:hypothetical protein